MYRTSKWVRYALTGLSAAVLILAATVAFVVVLLLELKSARDHEAADRQRAINDTFCNVMAQLPANSPELDQIRHQLHCTSPGLSPEQMRQLATTGGTP